MEVLNLLGGYVKDVKYMWVSCPVRKGLILNFL